MLILIVVGQYIHAGENRTEFMVDFRVNIMRIDLTYSGNEARVQEIVSFLKDLTADSTITVTSVTFCGAASPEGSYLWNRTLAAGRLRALETLVRKEINLPDSIIARDDSYISWEYLREQVLRSGAVYKDTVLSIIDEQPVLVKDCDSGKPVDRRIVMLKQLDGRRVWNELFRLYFRKMRNASAVIVTYEESRPRLSPLPPVPSSLVSVEVDDTDPVDVAPLPHICAPFFMAVYTNMLYDALAVPNIGVEFYLGKNFSVAANWMHAWWSYDRRHRYWRIYGGEINARYWFGRAATEKPLTGHHLGLYAQALTYDFEFGGKAYMGGEPGGTILDRAHFGGGVEYGYSLPVSRRLNIDFTVGVGYIGGRVYEFVPDNDRYLWTATKSRHWFGPTKLEVSLVWLIGRGNVNKSKGGAR